MPGMMDTILNLGLNDETIKEDLNSTDVDFSYMGDCDGWWRDLDRACLRG